MVSPNMYVQIGEKKIGLDNGYYEDAFLSHAHSDHTKGISKVKSLLSSKETKHILGLEKDGLDEHSLKFLEMRDAGHMLGSKQLVAEEDGRKTVYTGDIRVKPGIFGKGAEVIECDRLIIEATFSRKIFSFPDVFDVYEDIKKEVATQLLKGNSILFGAYPIGKSQELIKVINEYLGLTVVVDEKVSHFSSKYKELGIKLDFVSIAEEESKELTRESFVYITSPSSLKKENVMNLVMKYSMPFKLFYATGWALKFSFRGYDKIFPLSDHADFNDLMYYIENSGAKEVFLFGGERGDLTQNNSINKIKLIT